MLVSDRFERGTRPWERRGVTVSRLGGKGRKRNGLQVIYPGRTLRQGVHTLQQATQRDETHPIPAGSSCRAEQTCRTRPTAALITARR